MVKVSRFDIFLIALDPTVGREIKKTRPCIVVSPDEMNHTLGTVIIAPMTSKTKPYPTRVPIAFQGKKGQVALDHLRSVDKVRLVKKLGRASAEAAAGISAILVEMFEA